MSKIKKDEPLLADITDTTPEVRTALLKKFAAMTDAERLDVLSLQTDLLRYYLKYFKTGPALSLGTLVEALKKRVETTEILGRKSAYDDRSDRASRLLRMRLDSMKESKEGKKEAMYRKKYHWLVRDLRKEGEGWRGCAAYLKKFHRFEISHSHLKKLFEKYDAA